MLTLKHSLILCVINYAALNVTFKSFFNLSDAKPFLLEVT